MESEKIESVQKPYKNFLSEFCQGDKVSPFGSNFGHHTYFYSHTPLTFTDMFLFFCAKL